MSRIAKPLISFSVPIYNVEKHLGECLDSPSWNIEVICINDGSTDSSREIKRLNEERRAALLFTMREDVERDELTRYFDARDLDPEKHAFRSVLLEKPKL